jgi:hypothetical protein
MTRVVHCRNLGKFEQGTAPHVVNKTFVVTAEVKRVAQVPFCREYSAQYYQ